MTVTVDWIAPIVLVVLGLRAVWCFRCWCREQDAYIARLRERTLRSKEDVLWNHYRGDETDRAWQIGESEGVGPVRRAS